MLYLYSRRAVAGVTALLFSALLGFWPSAAMLQTTSINIDPGSYTVSMNEQTVAVLCLPENQLTAQKLVHELMRSSAACQLEISPGASGYQSAIASCSGSPNNDDRSRILSSSVVDNSLRVVFQTRSQYASWSDANKQEVAVAQKSATALKFQLTDAETSSPIDASATRTGDCKALSVLPIQHGLYSFVASPGRESCVVGDAITAFDIVRIAMSDSCRFQSKVDGNKLNLSKIECQGENLKWSISASVNSNALSIEMQKPAEISANAWKKSGLEKTRILQRTGHCN